MGKHQRHSRVQAQGGAATQLAGGPKARAEGLEQTARYMARCGAAEGWLVIFDRKPGKSWDEKITWATEAIPDGKTIHVVGC